MTLTAPRRQPRRVQTDHRPPTVLDEPTSMEHAAAILLAMPLQAFYDVVDRDVRGDDRLGPDEQPLHPLYVVALRSSDVCDRWFQALVRMKKSTEMTLAAKGLDDKASRHRMEQANQRAEADEQRIRHLKWRAGAIRFLTGVEERLSEANFHRRKHFGNDLPTHLTMERDRLSEYVRLLTDAIEQHRDDCARPDATDRKLWSVVNDEALIVTD